VSVARPGPWRSAGTLPSLKVFGLRRTLRRQAGHRRAFRYGRAVPLPPGPQGPLGKQATHYYDAIRRRVFERSLRLLPIEQVGPLIRLGSDWGGWMIPDVIGESSVAYCAGAGGDISFDLELLSRGATVRAIDPSRVFRDKALAAAEGNPRFTFHQVALAANDGTLTMYGTVGADGVMSAGNVYRTTEARQVPARSLISLMREAGDNRIDLLKLDIEGSEYDVLESLSPAALGVQVLCVELHHTSSPVRARRLLKRLNADYRLAHLSRRSDVTLVRR